MSKIIEDLNWRYATKKFDPTKKISDADIETIKESLRLVPTSYGLQPLKYIFIDSPELRKKLTPASYGQSQIEDASHLVVLCSMIDVKEEDVDNYMQNIIDERNVSAESLEPYSNTIKGSLNNMNGQDLANWTGKQAYIALGQLLHTCASLRIDATPMEGFDPKAYDEVLNLADSNLRATLVCTMGYRHEEDPVQYWKKVRKSREDIIEVR